MTIKTIKRSLILRIFKPFYLRYVFVVLDIFATFLKNGEISFFILEDSRGFYEIDSPTWIFLEESAFSRKFPNSNIRQNSTSRFSESMAEAKWFQVTSPNFKLWDHFNVTIRCALYGEILLGVFSQNGHTQNGVARKSNIERALGFKLLNSQLFTSVCKWPSNLA